MYFENGNELERIFGEWPSFHDAEVIRASLDRSSDEAPTLELVIQVFQMTPEVDSKGYFVLKNHTEVRMLFTKIALSRFEWFNHQTYCHPWRLRKFQPLSTMEGDSV